jgi:hypothetical protein
LTKVSLSKTIEATKLNKRTGFPESGPEVTIPFGALVEYVGADRDLEKFNYLGEPYRCKHDLWMSAATGHAHTAAAGSSKPGDALQPAPEGPKLIWEPVPSTQYSLSRAKVPGGWLIALGGTGLAFYPDSAHEWDGTSLA